MIHSHRRRFLQSVTAATMASSGLLAFSPLAPSFLCHAAALGQEASSSERILVVVQLSGGNDGLNTIIPLDDDRYQASRPSIAIDRNAALKIDDRFGFHPSMRGFAELLEKNELSILQGIGYPNPNRSHFESMDIWHTCQMDPQERSTGWIGKYLELYQQDRPVSDSPDAMHLGGEVQPLALASRLVAVPSVRSIDQFRFEGVDEAGIETIEQLAKSEREQENDLLQFVTLRTTSAHQVARRIQSASSLARPNVNYPNSGLADKLKQISQLIHAGLGTKIYYVSLDGFDTHSDQLGAHASLWDQVSGALASFQNDLRESGQADRVATLVFSEFGRRVKENSSRGTDHGAAAPAFLIGSKVKSGLIGKFPDLGDLDDGDQKYHTDFRRIYRSLLSDWFGWDAAAVLRGEYDRLPLFV